MPDKQTAIKRAKAFLNECKNLPFSIDKAFLFGSVVQGKWTEISDIDLALFSTAFTNNILSNIDLYGKVNIHFPEIDVHAYPSDDFQTDSITIEQIKKTGIEITV